MVTPQEVFDTVENNNFPKLQILLAPSNKTLLNAEDANGNTLLHIAAKNGNVKILLHLISLGCNLNKQNKDGNTALHLAAKEQKDIIIIWLVKKGAEFESIRNQEGKVALDTISGRIRDFISLYQDSLLRIPNAYGEMQTRATRTKVPPELKEQLDEAVKRGDLTAARELIEVKKVDFEARNMEGKNSLHLACEYGHHHIVDYLLEKGANVDKEEEYMNTPLIIATCKCHHGIVEKLIKAGATVNCISLFGHSPMVLAAQLGFLEVAKVLRELGKADITITDKMGNTALHLAIEHGHVEVAKYLISCGGDLTLKNSKGQTPLDLATSSIRCMITGEVMEDHGTYPVEGNVPLSAEEALSSSPFGSGESLTSLKKMEINYNDLELAELIGEGNFGDVFKGKYQQTDVAVKKIHAQYWKTSNNMKLLANEISILFSCQHENIVKLVGACLKPPNLCIVSEWLKKGSLAHVLHKKKMKLNMGLLLKLAKGVAEAMRFLHSRNVVHRDLRSANILVSKQWVAKVGDFGLSCRISDGDDPSQTGIGPLRWMAPELHKKERFNEKVDVYSYGLLLWEMIACEVPFVELSPLAAADFAASGKRPSFNQEMTNEFGAELLRLTANCWAATATERPSFEEITSSISSCSTNANVVLT